jgi:hypothetical protein
MRVLSCVPRHAAAARDSRRQRLRGLIMRFFRVFRGYVSASSTIPRTQLLVVTRCLSNEPL